MANEIRWKGRAVYVALGPESESFADRVALIRPPESGLTREAIPLEDFVVPHSKLYHSTRTGANGARRSCQPALS